MTRADRLDEVVLAEGLVIVPGAGEEDEEALGGRLRISSVLELVHRHGGWKEQPAAREECQRQTSLHGAKGSLSGGDVARSNRTAARTRPPACRSATGTRSEEHTSELQ